MLRFLGIDLDLKQIMKSDGTSYPATLQRDDLHFIFLSPSQLFPRAHLHSQSRQTLFPLRVLKRLSPGINCQWCISNLGFAKCPPD
jgi:hypothetical protein